MNNSSRFTKSLWAVLLGLGLFAADTGAQTYDVLRTFASAGLYPQAGLIQGTDGNLYGTTYQGGANSSGTIFKIDTNGTTLTTLHSFAGADGALPFASLIQGADGNLYGTTDAGGAGTYGTIFKMDPNGTTLTTLHAFTGTDGAGPTAGLIQGTDGNLYGTAASGGSGSCMYGCGTIFKIGTDGTAFTVLYNFAGGDGASPQGGLIQGTDGKLYGTTYQGGANDDGTIFKIDTNGSTLTTLHSFAGGTDGINPFAGLMQGTDGNLYGTTVTGTVFKIGSDGAAFATLHSLISSEGAYLYAGLMQGMDGNLYGTADAGGSNVCGGGCGTIFKIDTGGTTFIVLHSFAGSDGNSPKGALIRGSDGNLYGTTAGNGAMGYGTAFKIDTDGSTLTTLHTFSPYGDGAYPRAGLIQGTDGNLYGTTRDFGASGDYGTIFKIDTNGITFTILHSFAGSDGAIPYGGLIQGTEGNLYGTTESGGASGYPGYGTIFRIDTSGTTFTTLHSFAGSDGASPFGGLVQGLDGNLYGTTAGGGPSDAGTIFRIDTNGTTLTTLHSFAGGTDGSNPYGSLIQGTDGNLYGTTYQGGSGSCIYGCGTIFKIDTNGTTFTTLHSFTGGSDGLGPQAGLVEGTDGNLYGTTSYSGGGGLGTIFKIDTTGSTLTTLHSFAGTDGSSPYAGLIQGTDGDLYGTTFQGGAGGYGAVFKTDTSGSTFTTLHSFTGSDGASPIAGLIQTVDGNLYGTASAGGPAGGGVLFRIALGCFGDVPPTDPFSTFICTVARHGITAGCGAGNYCPGDPVTRAQMAVFLLRGEHGPGYAPPGCTGIFNDVTCTPGVGFSDWIEQLSSEGITAGCGGGDYCPDNPVTRAQMAVFLLKAEHGSGYTPPACAGIFQDVACMPSPAFAVDWIEQLSAEGVTGGCSASPPLYCSENPNTRGQMAVFLTKTFGLQ